MAASLTLSIIEIVVLLLGAIILGITIHFFITSRKNLRIPKDEPGRTELARNEWKLKYFNDIELKDREIAALTNRVNTAEENADEFAMELEDVKQNYKSLKISSEASRKEDNHQEMIDSLREEKRLLEKQLSTAWQKDGELNELERVVAGLREQNDQLQSQLAAFARISEEQQSGELDREMMASLEEQNRQLRDQLFTMSQQAGSQEESARQLIADLRSEVSRLQGELAAGTEGREEREDQPAHYQDDYLQRLMEAKHSLLEHNQKISELLGNIEVIREKEELQQELARTNEELAAQIDAMRHQLAEKESEVNNIRQKETLSKEMSSMLDHAYNDFNILQDKIHKLEAQLTSSRMQSLDYEDLKESQLKLAADMDRYRQKSQSLTAENLQLQQELNMVEDKLKEANQQRQQLQKKVAYLEEINSDLQSVSEANKKLEGQLRRIGELESMLNVVSEERDQLQRQAQSSQEHPPYS